MEITTRKSEAATVAARHFAQYKRYPRDYRTQDGRDPREVNKQLVALGPTPDPDEVDKIIGNGSWTDVDQCMGCGRKELDRVLTFGGDETFSLCELCVEQAHILLQGKQQ